MLGPIPKLHGREDHRVIEASPWRIAVLWDHVWRHPRIQGGAHAGNLLVRERDSVLPVSKLVSNGSHEVKVMPLGRRDKAECIRPIDSC